jgi:hypothetical protein
MKRLKWPIIIITTALFSVVGLTGCFIGGFGNTASYASDFPDYDTLASWVDSNTQPFEEGDGAEAWYQAALDVQRAASEDGYLVSAVITVNPGNPEEYLVWCTAMADGDLYWWYPEEGKPSIMFTVEELGE